MIQYKEKSDCAEYTPKKDCRIVCCKENKKDFYQSSRGETFFEINDVSLR